MSNKKEKTTAPVAKTEDAAEAKRLDKTRLFLIIFGAVALVAILASIIVAVAVNSSKSFDYMKKNLSRYVSVPADVYASFDVTVDALDIKDQDIKDKVISILCKNKITPEGGALNKKDAKINAGDILNFFYRGYTLGENDEKEYFNGGCNFNQQIGTDKTKLEIGSGSFVSGFEYNLIGKNPKDYATLNKITTGDFDGYDSFALTYTVSYADGTVKKAQTALIRLSDPKLDEKWGEGFKAYFESGDFDIGVEFATGKDGDSALTVPTVKTAANGATQDVYTDMKITEAYQITDAPVMVIEAYFPENYQEESLQGKTAYFECYIKTVEDYDAPELNEEFFTEKLKVSAEEYAALEGDTLEKKLENYLRSELEKEYESNVQAIVEETFWTRAMEKSEVKKFPESDVRAYYDSSLASMESAYSNYQSYYSSFDAFARAYLSLGSTDDWQSALMATAEDAIKQKLVFYYIIREEGYIPTEEQFNSIREDVYSDYLQSYLDYYGIEESDSDYAEQLEAAKAAVDAEYDDEYWQTNIIYEFGMNKICENANIIYK